jgi:DNA-binding NarL/FixJ family response regulator
MEIAEVTFYIIDPDMQRRNALARLLSTKGRSVPLDNVSELGSVTATSPCFLVHDDNDQVMATLGEAITPSNPVPVLVYTAQPDLERVYEVTDMGASGCFTYDVPNADPSEQIMRLLTRDARMQRVRRRRQTAARKLQILTRREHEVLTAVSRGESNKAIARDMCISPRTVEVHRRSMIAKLDVPCSISAVRVALEAEL